MSVFCCVLEPFGFSFVNDVTLDTFSLSSLCCCISLCLASASEKERKRERDGGWVGG